ncbi:MULTISPECIES: bifunctional UDP-sugar hydrolase/5'-nucleotidase [Listeria]|uniref:bifunctional metallophosphatase/5'-nucleotidase n=1 Tax=Listeria TaxID=1637 RepID=UPI000B5912A5|nr:MULTISPECIES: bifunctional UDP-sugar hydrolase/5'-nucleotidase [Listeria]
MKKLQIWHTNDIHSHLENWPRIKTFLAEKKEENASDSLLFDIGDFLDRVHPLTEGSAGKANVELLNELAYDAVTIGNNEGTTLSHEQLSTLYDNANFPVVCANVYSDVARTKRVDWALPFIYKEVNGIKMAVIGVTAAFSEYYESLGWGIREPIQCIREQIAALDADTDFIILLSHLGLPSDEQIAVEIPEIDVILGSHTHHLLENGKTIGSTLLAACGRWGEYVGEVTVTFSDENAVLGKTATVYKTETLPAPNDEEAQIAAFFEKGKNMLSKKVVALPEKLEHNWFGESKIAEVFYEAACAFSGADTFLTNAGIYMSDLEKGDVTAFDIHQLLPHPLNLIAVTLSGQELEVLIQEIVRKQDELREFPLKGFGFRGEIFGAVLMKRMGFDPTSSAPLWDGKPIDPSRNYRIVTHDTFVYAPFFPIIKQVKKKEVYTPELLRDILTWQLKKLYGEEKE